MPAESASPSVASHFEKSVPAVKATYAAILKAARAQIKMTAPSDVDAELKSWLSEAYELASR